MQNETPWIKAAASLVLAAGVTLWGWFGWLVVAWVCAMALDFVSGVGAAAKAGELSSKIARAGLFHKGGMLLVVFVAGLLDVLIGVIIRGTGVVLPFKYTVLVCPLVLVWYTLTELVSVLENAVKWGAPVPGWLKKLLQSGKDAIDQQGEDLSK